MEGFFERHAAHEVGHLAHGHVGAVEQDVRGARLQAGGLEDVGQAHTGPAGVADRAVAPLHAGYARLVEAAAVAGAFQHGHLLHARELFNVRHVEGELAFDQTVHAQAPVGQSHFWLVDVSAHEEVFGGSEPGIEPGKRHFEIFRVGGADHQVFAALIAAKSESGGEGKEVEEAAAGEGHIYRFILSI